MARRLTAAERLAAATADIRLETIADQSSWDRFLVEQAVLHFGTRHRDFSANDLRDVLPELGHGYLGAAISSLNSGGIIRATGQTVPSTLASTRGHRITVWALTARGRAIAAARARRPEAAA